VVVSGFAHPDFDVNEAELLASRATKLGVPAEKIIIEPRATNTGLNIILAADALKKRGVTPQAVVLVHKPYMTRRFLATAEAQWPTPRPKFYVTSVNLTFDEYIRLEKSRELDERALSSILKDYQSIKDYPARGFQSAQPTSPEAEQAFQRLIKRGFLPMPREDNLSTDNFR
jgi:uncharacterized SAM-binding protein YcdF (DUF218 family)